MLGKYHVYPHLTTQLPIHYSHLFSYAVLCGLGYWALLNKLQVLNLKELVYILTLHEVVLYIFVMEVCAVIWCVLCTDWILFWHCTQHKTEMFSVQQYSGIRIGVVYVTKQWRNLKKHNYYITFYYQFSCYILCVMPFTLNIFVYIV